MQRVMVLGATSAIAQEVARIFAARGDTLYLVARNADRLNAVAQDLRVRSGQTAKLKILDLDAVEKHPGLVDEAVQALGGLDTVLVAHGVLGDQKLAERDYAAAQSVLHTNFLSVVSLLTPIANYFEQQQSGRIVVISSVAGDRGRQSNYIYGASKAALDAFLQGLRNRLFASNVAVTTVKPGFVDTPMTAHLKKGPLFVRARVVAQGIVRASDLRKDIVYLPWFWLGIMAIIRFIPERFFKRLKL